MPKVPPPCRNGRTIVVGFSVRALAEATAVCLGSPIAVDRFADQDCSNISHRAITLHQWGSPHHPYGRLLRQLKSAGATKESLVLLGGGTENWPELVEWLHSHFQVMGPTTDQLRQLRCAEFWEAASRQTEIRFPLTSWRKPIAASSGAASNREDGWLTKPRNGAGGYSVRRDDCNEISQSTSSDYYWQRYISGRVLGAYCLIDSEGQIVLLGVTEALSGEQWPGPSEFIYRGSLGPIVVHASQQAQIVELCQIIGATVDYHGWLQLDLVEDESGQLWLLELNPRWSAGMEILLLAGINPVELHLRASNQGALETAASGLKGTSCENRVSSPIGCWSHSNEKTFGKAVVYADRDLQLTHECIERWLALPRPSFADLPSHSAIPPGELSHTIHKGEPLLTVRACGSHASLLPQLIELRQLALAIPIS